MYIPPAFAETDPSRLHDFIEANSFGLLITQVEGKPFASHLPMLLDRGAGPHGQLIGHMARANPQWRQAGGTDALAVFSGPHVYVSPTWYEAEHVVPTWNYLAVHASGPLTAIEDAPTLTEIVKRYVRVYENALPRPWTLDSSSFVQRLVTQIVGFRIAIDRLEGKWKLNQNQPEERRRRVIRALQARTDENSLAIAKLIEETLASDREA